MFLNAMHWWKEAERSLKTQHAFHALFGPKIIQTVGVVAKNMRFLVSADDSWSDGHNEGQQHWTAKNKSTLSASNKRILTNVIYSMNVDEVSNL